MGLLRTFFLFCTLMVISQKLFAFCSDSFGDPIVSAPINIDSPSDVYIGIDFITTSVWGDPSKISQIQSVNIDDVYCSNDWSIKVVPANYPSTGNKGYMSTNVKSILLSTNIAITGSTYDFNTPPKSIRTGFPVSVSTVSFDMEKSSVVSKGPGVISGGPIAYVKIVEGGMEYDLASININAINVHAGACSVSNGITVDLGTHPRQFFDKVGTTTATVPFQIAISCDPMIKVYGRFDGVDTNPFVDGLFALDNQQNSASGIGVMIKSDTVPPVTMKNGQTNIWLDQTPFNNPTLNLRFLAQYYQFSPTVTAGNANASVTYTLTYD